MALTTSDCSVLASPLRPISERRPNRDGAHHQRLQRVAVAREAVDAGGERSEADCGAFAAWSGGGPAHACCERIDDDCFADACGAGVAVAVAAGCGGGEIEIDV